LSQKEVVLYQIVTEKWIYW